MRVPLTDEQILRRIDEVAATGAETLDLSYLELAALPAEIGKLDHLTALDLCGNDLVALPPQLGRLRQLTRLDLRHNQLVALPPEIGLLTGLNLTGSPG